MGEQAGHKDAATKIIDSYPERLRSAFSRCLTGSPKVPKAEVDRRAAMLAAATLGVWVIARVDPRVASGRCEEIAREVASWSRRSDSARKRKPRRSDAD
jgi:hypothetical protein